MKLTLSYVTWYKRMTYFAQCEKSRLVCQMLRQKTLTPGNVEALKTLGFTIEIVPHVFQD